MNGLDKNTLSKLTQAMDATKQELTTLQTQLSTSKEALTSLENSLQTVQQAMTGLDTFQTQFEALVASVNQTVENDQSKIQSFNAQLESAKEAQLQALQSSIQALQTSKSAIPQEDTTGAASKIDEQITGLQTQLQVVQSIDVQGYTLETLDVQKGHGRYKIRYAKAADIYADSRSVHGYLRTNHDRCSSEYERSRFCSTHHKAAGWSQSVKSRR